MTTLARGLAVGGSFLTAQALSLWALLGPVSNADWMKGFRAYFSKDQLLLRGNSGKWLTGLRIVRRATHRNWRELLSQRGWYHFLVLVNNVTGVPVNLLWQVLGLAAIGIAIAILGLIAYTLSRLWWAPILPGLALFTGTLSTFIHDDWYTSLSAHAVIWGPFGTLFTPNSGAIALMGGTVALALILWHQLAPSRSNTRIFIAAALIGLLANLHTYAFFTTVSFAAALISLTALITAKSTRRTVLVIAAARLAVLVVAVLLWLISLAGFAGFFSYAREQGVLPTQDSRALATQELTKEIPSGSRELILSRRCTDPQLLKLITSRPVAFFNYGLAWPNNREEIKNLTPADRMTGNTLIGLQAAHVGYVITDSNCESDLAYTEAGINIISITPYDSGALTLWRVTA